LVGVLSKLTSFDTLILSLSVRSTVQVLSSLIDTAGRTDLIDASIGSLFVILGFC
jgi:hypothetical protein